MDRKSRRFQAAIVAAIAAAAMAGAVYGIGGGSGNAGGNCSAAVDKAKQLEAVATGDMAAFRLAEEGIAVSDLTFADATGQKKRLGDWKGRTALLNLWATWCAPCRAEMPALDSLQRELGGADFAVVAVSVDLGDDAKPKRFYEEIGISALAFHHDGSMALFNQLKKIGLAFGLPVSLLIDRDGCVLGVLNAPAEWAGADAKALIGRAIGLASN